MDEKGYQTVVWNKGKQDDYSYGVRLTKQEADKTLAEAMKSGIIDGKVIPYSKEPGHYKTLGGEAGS